MIDGGSNSGFATDEAGIFKKIKSHMTTNIRVTVIGIFTSWGSQTKKNRIYLLRCGVVVSTLDWDAYL